MGKLMDVPRFFYHCPSFKIGLFGLSLKFIFKNSSYVDLRITRFVGNNNVKAFSPCLAV